MKKRIVFDLDGTLAQSKTAIYFTNLFKIKIMVNFKTFDLSISTLILRFYFMMAVIAISGFLNQWILAAILGFAVAISLITGISVHILHPEKLAISEKEAKLRSIEKAAIARNAA